MVAGLNERVGALIQRYYGGNVLETARAMNSLGHSMSAATLDRIARGDTRNPRASALQAIADHFGTTVDWLLTGRGMAPGQGEEWKQWSGSNPDATGWLEYFSAARRVAGDDMALRLGLYQLPAAAGQAVVSLGLHAAKREGRTIAEERPSLEKISEEAIARHAGEWGRTLAALVVRYGADATAAALRESPMSFALGFLPFALWLRRHKGLPKDDQLEHFYLRFAAEKFGVELPGGS